RAGGPERRARRPRSAAGHGRSDAVRAARCVLRASHRRATGRPLTMASETIGNMSSRTRLIVMTISAPVIAFAIVGGFLSKVMAREDAYPQLKIFGDVVDMISSSYVEEVNMDKVMVGAMKGLADNLDPDSAFLSAAE